MTIAELDAAIERMVADIEVYEDRYSDAADTLHAARARLDDLVAQRRRLADGQG